jgi:hypothetical protein
LELNQRPLPPKGVLYAELSGQRPFTYTPDSESGRTTYTVHLSYSIGGEGRTFTCNLRAHYARRSELSYLPAFATSFTFNRDSSPRTGISLQCDSPVVLSRSSQDSNLLSLHGLLQLLPWGRMGLNHRPSG